MSDKERLKSETFGNIAAVAMLPLSVYALKYGFTQGPHNASDALLCSVGALSPWIARMGVTFCAMMYAAYFTDDEQRQRTRLSDYGTVRKLAITLKKESSQVLRSKYMSTESTVDLVEELSKCMRQLEEKEYDSAFEILSIINERAGSYQTTSFKGDYLRICGKLAMGVGVLLSPTNTEMYMVAAGFQSIRNPKKAWFYSRLGCLVAQEFNTPFRKEMFVFDALLASAQGRSDEELAWGRALSVICEDPVWERIGESRSIVRRLNNSRFFANTFVFKEGNEQDLLVELENSKTLEALTELNVAKVLYVSECDEFGKSTLVMRYAKGDTLQENFERGKFDCLPVVVRALAKIHGSYPADSLVEINLEDKLCAKLYDSDLQLPWYVCKSIMDNLEPLIQSFFAVPWVWSKDAHPENWLVGDSVTVLDCEGKFKAPCVFDLANLLEYSSCLSQAQIKDASSLYFESLEKEGLSVEHGLRAKVYNDAVVYRMICLAAAWSGPHRMSMHSKRAKAFSRASAAIGRLACDNSGLYCAFASEYGRLKSALGVAANLMDS